MFPFVASVSVLHRFVAASLFVFCSALVPPLSLSPSSLPLLFLSAIWPSLSLSISFLFFSLLLSHCTPSLSLIISLSLSFLSYLSSLSTLSSSRNLSSRSHPLLLSSSILALIFYIRFSLSLSHLSAQYLSFPPHSLSDSLTPPPPSFPPYHLSPLPPILLSLSPSSSLYSLSLLLSLISRSPLLLLSLLSLSHFTSLSLLISYLSSSSIDSTLTTLRLTYLTIHHHSHSHSPLIFRTHLSLSLTPSTLPIPPSLNMPSILAYPPLSLSLPIASPSHPLLPCSYPSLHPHPCLRSFYPLSLTILCNILYLLPSFSLSSLSSHLPLALPLPLSHSYCLHTHLSSPCVYPTLSPSILASLLSSTPSIHMPLPPSSLSLLTLRSLPLSLFLCHSPPFSIPLLAKSLLNLPLSLPNPRTSLPHPLRCPRSLSPSYYLASHHSLNTSPCFLHSLSTSSSLPLSLLSTHNTLSLPPALCLLPPSLPLSLSHPIPPSIPLPPSLPHIPLPPPSLYPSPYLSLSSKSKMLPNEIKLLLLKLSTKPIALSREIRSMMMVIFL
ncbi:hypothetical protein C7M84_003137 [Penaeus vannamei]|uniref:Uncharacterized protein n=1 Tax=Penaeus vannamei TaxID=6689 RepID=A0A3R7MJA2_PENVA|nr:hypothetical protein C7M84_003137 [Penaeus vannamei]